VSYTKLPSCEIWPTLCAWIEQIAMGHYREWDAGHRDIMIILNRMIFAAGLALSALMLGACSQVQRPAQSDIQVFRIVSASDPDGLTDVYLVRKDGSGFHGLYDQDQKTFRNFVVERREFGAGTIEFSKILSNISDLQNYSGDDLSVESMQTHIESKEFKKTIPCKFEVFDAGNYSITWNTENPEIYDEDIDAFVRNVFIIDNGCKHPVAMEYLRRIKIVTKQIERTAEIHGKLVKP
jgi:hypothetical protein